MSSLTAERLCCVTDWVHSLQHVDWQSMNYWWKQLLIAMLSLQCSRLCCQWWLELIVKWQCFTLNSATLITELIDIDAECHILFIAAGKSWFMGSVRFIWLSSCFHLVFHTCVDGMYYGTHTRGDQKVLQFTTLIDKLAKISCWMRIVKCYLVITLRNKYPPLPSERAIQGL